MCVPCGACRQWLSEFCSDNKELKIILENKNSEIEILSLNDIFPYEFKFD